MTVDHSEYTSGYQIAVAALCFISCKPILPKSNRKCINELKNDLNKFTQFPFKYQNIRVTPKNVS